MTRPPGRAGGKGDSMAGDDELRQARADIEDLRRDLAEARDTLRLLTVQLGPASIRAKFDNALF